MKIMFVSLGCDKNLVDTEKMIGQVAACHSRDGQYLFEFTDDELEAEVIVINTCCFQYGRHPESDLQDLPVLLSAQQN